MGYLQTKWRKAYSMNFCPCREKPDTCHTTKMGNPTLVLITHLAAEIMLIAFLNQGYEIPPWGLNVTSTQM
jgi:hypothetical protein